MKKLALLLAAVLVCTLCYGAASASAKGADSFRMGGEGRTVQYYPAVVLPNGNMILSLYTQGGFGGELLAATGHYRTCIACVGPQNEILWSRFFEGTTVAHDAVVYSVCRLNIAQDGSLAVLLRQRTPQEGAYFLPILLDADTGALLQTGAKIPYEISNEAIDRYVVTWNLENVYIQKKTDAFSTANSTSIIEAYDYENHLLWRQSMDSLPMDTLTACLETPAGILLTGNAVARMSNDQIANHTVFAFVDPAGQSVWTHVFDGAQTSSIVATLNSDAQLMLLGNLANGENTAAEEVWQYLACMEPATGAVRWEQAMPFAPDAPLPVGALLPTGTGYLLLGEANGQTVCETVDRQGTALDTWRKNIAMNGDFATLQYFYRGDALWVARMDIALRHSFMQYDRVGGKP